MKNKTPYFLLQFKFNSSTHQQKIEIYTFCFIWRSQQLKIVCVFFFANKRNWQFIVSSSRLVWQMFSKICKHRVQVLLLCRLENCRCECVSLSSGYWIRTTLKSGKNSDRNYKPARAMLIVKIVSCQRVLQVITSAVIVILDGYYLTRERNLFYFCLYRKSEKPAVEIVDSVI